MSDSRTLVLNILRELGKKQSEDFRQKALSMTDSEIIANEYLIPEFDSSKDYSDWSTGSPVTYNGQVYGLLQPHNASFYPDSNPMNNRALWNLKHTKTPKDAKPFVEPQGISGLYMKDECYVDQNGNIYICNEDNTIYNAVDLPSAWHEYIEI